MVSVAGYSPSQQHGGPPSISMARSASSDASTFAQCQQQAQQQQHAPGTTTKSASRSHSHSQLQSQSHSLSSSVAAQAVSPSMSMSASASASASQLPNGSFGATSSPNSSGLPSSSNGYSNMPHSAFAVGGSHPPPGGPYHHHAPFANSNGSAQHMPPPHHGGTTGSAAYPPEVQAMMYAAYQQQQQHWSAQMAMVHAQNDPRRRAPSLPTASASAAYHHLQQQQQAQPFYPQQAFPQSQSMQFAHPQQQQQFRQPYPSPSFQQQPQHQQQQQQQYFRSHHSHSASSSPAGSPLPPRGASPLPPQQQQQHSPLPHQQYQQQLYSPQPPFAVQQQQRPASPNSSQIAADQNLRRRTESSPNDARFQPPQAHAQAQVQGQVPPGAGLQPGAAAAAFRGRTDSGVSTRSAPSSGQAQSPLPPSASTSFRSASPASSDRASTPTQGAAGGRTTPTVASSSSSSSSSLSARPPILGSASSFPAGQSQGQGQQHAALQPPVNLVKSPSSPSLQAHSAGGAGLPRKASPLSQQPHNKRSSTPTQASPFSGDRDDESSHTASAVGDNAITHPVTAAAGSASSATTVAAIAGKGHQSTLSNASSVMTSSSTSPQTSSSSSASGKGSSMFRNKLRKALSLNELGNSSSSSLDSSKIGRASLTSNSSSSDTSHSTMEPRTPPNGASPVLPSRFAASSASNLHKRANGIAGAQDSSMGGAAKRSGGMRRQASESNLGQQGTGPTGAGGSLPSNSGRRFGLLNNKMNSSTDNISISSTVSSASVMLRKMGNLGKLARKSSVRSLSNMFHRGERERFSDTAAEAHSRATSDAVSEFGVPGASMANGRDRDHRQKGGAATPSVAYVTAELESGSNAQGMTPAEALVRKHQEKEAEEARKRAAAAAAAAAASSGAESPRSKLLEKEKEKLKASSGGKDKKKWGFGFNRSASSTSLRQEVASSAAGTPAAVDTVRQQQLVSVHSAVAAAEAARAPTPIVPSVRPSLDGIALDSWRTQSQGLPPGATLHHHDGRRAVFDDDEDEEDARQGEGGDDDDDEGFDDRTPRQSMEVLGDQSGSSPGVDEPYADWDGEPPNTGSYFEDDTASFTNATVSNTSGAVHAAGPEEYDDGGHDGRSGQRIPERPHKNAQPARGILKYARSYSQDNLTRPQPAFNRPRASSYDAPHQMSPPNQPGKLAALAQVIPSEAQVDGVDHHPRTAARLDTFSQAEDKENISPGAMGMPSGSGKGGQQHQQPHHGSPYGNPGFNNSVPVLSNLSAVHMQTRSMTGPHVRRKISFANNLSVHTTWPGNIYDRRGEQATCNRLTPQLAQRIKEELNAFKMEEMEVHHMSRNFTHFFI